MASGWVGASGWFPGHMAKATRELSQRLSKVDFVIEVRDARLPVSSAAAHLDVLLRESGRQNRRLIALNKMDLVSEAQREDISRHVGESIRLISTRTGAGVKDLLETVVAAVKQHSPKLGQRTSLLPTLTSLPTRRTSDHDRSATAFEAAPVGHDLIHTESARAMRLSGGSAPRIYPGGALPLILMVVGVPNTGKSSLINALRKATAPKRERMRKSTKPAKTGSMPGVTRHLSGFQVCGVLRSCLLCGIHLDQCCLVLPRVRSSSEDLPCCTLVGHHTSLRCSSPVADAPFLFLYPQVSWDPPVFVLDTPGVLAPRLEGGWLTALRLGAADLIAHSRGDDEALATFVLYTLAAHYRHQLDCWPRAANQVEKLLARNGDLPHVHEEGQLTPLDFRLLLESNARLLEGCEALGAELLEAVALDMRQVQRGIPNTSATAGRLMKLLREGKLGKLLLEPLDSRADQWLTQARRERHRRP